MRPTHWRDAGMAVLWAIAAVTGFVLLLDGVLLGQHLTPHYVRLFTSPLIPRLPIFCLLAVIEEFKFRLLLMTALIAIQKLVGIKLSPMAFIAAIVISQFVNVGSFVMADPVYASLRYWAVGCVWGWLYWRHGWLAALTGHTACHLLLDPLLMLVLLHS